ncbi:MAG: NAD(P)H-dependent oxidoreductase [Solirubrobacteraceae bacterium]
MTGRLPPTRRVLLICGSARAGSTNAAVLRTAAAVVPTGVETVYFDGLQRLPLFNPDDDLEGNTPHPEVAALRAAVQASDCVLICTPEYAGALPAALKNVLEWTIGDAGTYGKPVAWINASGPAAPTQGADAHASLAKVLAYAGADVVAEACLRLPVSRGDVGPDGLLGDEAQRREIAGAVSRLADHRPQS